jgi:hypothetical protein
VREDDVARGGQAGTPGERAAADRADDGFHERANGEEDAAERLRELREQAGTTDKPFEVTVRVRPDLAEEDVARFAEAGVDRLVLELGSLGGEAEAAHLEQMTAFAERVVAR